MGLDLSNPFTGGTIINYEQGDRSLERFPIRYTPSAGDKIHTIIEGDRLDTISFLYYDNSSYSWLIYDVNADILTNPFDLIAGTELIIPDLEKISESNGN